MSDPNKSNKKQSQSESDGKSGSGEDWRRKKTTLIEKGAIEELPLIAYSNSKVDPHKFDQIKEALKTYIGKHYGWNNYMIDTNMEYSFPDVQIPEVPYNEDNDPMGIKRAELITKVKANSTRKEKYEENKPIVYTILWGQCSAALKMKLKESSNFSTYDTARNPLELWKDICSHCTTYSSHLRNKTLVQLEAKRGFENIFQRSDESIGGYYDRFNAAVTAMQRSGINLVNIPMKLNATTGNVEFDCDPNIVIDMEQEYLAISFLRSLDKKRHGPLLNELENYAHLGEDRYPKTLVGAYELASRRRDIASSKLADEVRAGQNPGVKGVGFNLTQKKKSYNKKNKSSNSKDSSKDEKQSNGKQMDNVECYLCNEKGHYRKDCPWITKAKELMEQTQSVEETTNVTIGHKGFPVRRKSIFLGDNLKKLKKDWILLDNQSTVNIFRNKDLLRNLRKSDDILEVSGIVDGESITTEWIGEYGDLPFPVYYHPKASANILCFYDVRNNCKNVAFDFDQNAFVVKTTSGKIITFSGIPDTKLYAFDSSVSNKSYPIVRTVQGMKERYTHEEIERADKALELVIGMGRPSAEVLMDALKRGAILDCPITHHDVRRMEKIYGKELGSIKGKTTRDSAKAIRFEYEDISESSSDVAIVDRKLTLCVDIAFFAGLPFLLSTSRRVSLLMVQFLTDRGHVKVQEALEYMISTYAHYGFEVSVILWDGEGSFGKLEPWLRTKGILVNPATKGEHVPDIERAIRTVKERVRAYVNMLPYKICLPILCHLVYFCVSMINSFPKRGNTVADMISPRELVTGIKPSYKVHTSVLFGEYCQVYEEDTKNDMTARTTGGIALGPAGNVQGGIYFLLLRSWRVVVRRKYTKLPLPSEVVDLLNAKAEKLKLHESVDLQAVANIQDHDYPEVANQNIDDEPQMDEETQDRIDEPNTAPQEHYDMLDLQFQDHAAVNHEIDHRRGEELEVEIEGVGDYPIDELHHDAIPTSDDVLIELQDVLGDMGDHADDPEELEETRRVIEEVMDTIHPNTNQRYSLRRTERKNYQDWESEYERRKGRIHTTYTMKKGLSKLKLPAVVAALKEINQLIKKKVFDFVEAKPHVRRRAVYVFMFLKVKRDTSVKARAVANGAQQDLPSELTSSPTIATEALLVTLVIDILDDCIVVTVDIEGAFLHALIMDDVYIVFDELCTSFILDLLGRNISHFVYEGKLYAKLNRALYGLVQAPRLFYLHLVNTLQELGLIQNLYEPCVFKLVRKENGKQIVVLTVTIHVDDLKISGRKQEDVDWLVNGLRAKYGKLNCHSEKIIDYLGMVLDFSVPGVLQLSLKTMIQEVVDDYSEDVKTAFSTPAKNCLFEVNDKSCPLVTGEKEKFHSCVQKLLYIGKHGRPDILLAVGFLTTRVNCPTEEDNGKLFRIIGYLKGTLELTLTFTVTQKHLRLEAYIDASYGVHDDMKSHSGLAILFCGNMVMCKSKKQKLNVKSSTEAEVVAVADYLPDVLWLKQFMEDLRGNDDMPVIIYQDNLSAKEIENAGNGKSNRTRHMNIRYFFVKDRIDKGELTIEYKCTEDMLADFFTKPLQGKRFQYTRNHIMNGTNY